MLLPDYTFILMNVYANKWWMDGPGNWPLYYFRVLQAFLSRAVQTEFSVISRFCCHTNCSEFCSSIVKPIFKPYLFSLTRLLHTRLYERSPVTRVRFSLSTAIHRPRPWCALYIIMCDVRSSPCRCSLTTVSAHSNQFKDVGGFWLPASQIWWSWRK